MRLCPRSGGFIIPLFWGLGPEVGRNGCKRPAFDVLYSSLPCCSPVSFMLRPCFSESEITVGNICDDPFGPSKHIKVSICPANGHSEQVRGPLGTIFGPLNLFAAIDSSW